MLIAETGPVTERLQVREIDDDEGRRLVRIIRRGSGSVVTWRRAQMVLLSAQGMEVQAIAKVAFTSEDRVRDVIRNFNADGFDLTWSLAKLADFLVAGGWLRAAMSHAGRSGSRGRGPGRSIYSSRLRVSAGRLAAAPGCVPAACSAWSARSAVPLMSRPLPTLSMLTATLVGNAPRGARFPWSPCHGNGLSWVQRKGMPARPLNSPYLICGDPLLGSCR